MDRRVFSSTKCQYRSLRFNHKQVHSTTKRDKEKLTVKKQIGIVNSESNLLPEGTHGGGNLCTGSDPHDT